MRRHARAVFAITALGSLFAFTGSASAAECPNEAIRIAQGATHLPDCRAYERVSPADSTGGVIGVDPQNRVLFGAARADGNAMTFGSSSGIGDTQRGALRTYNLAHRTDAGWSSFGVLSTTQPDVPMDISLSPLLAVPSSSMTRMMFVASRSLGPPNPVTSGGSIYLSAPEGIGPPTWLSRWSSAAAQPNPPSGTTIPLGGNPDLTTGYFRYATRLTSERADDLRTSNNGLYSFEDQTVAPAGILPSGTVSPQGALPAGSATTSGTGANTYLPEQARNQVSADGSKLFFVSPAEGAAPKQLYVQEGSGPGRLISHDDAGEPSPSGIAGLSEMEAGGNIVFDSLWKYPGYAFATPDGARVLFRSSSALTEDSPTEGVKTYRAAITDNSITLTYLPAVSGYPMAIDQDASTILFAAGDSKIKGQVSFYLWDEDRPDGMPYTIATKSESTGTRAVFEPRLSDDGNVLVFASDLELEPGSAMLPEPNYTQIYRWTEQSETSVCISCRRDGGVPTRFGSHMTAMNGSPTDNPAFLNGASAAVANQATVVGNRKISSDGSRVFFDTSDPLDPARDVNNTRDVYMWENGKVHLLTSGRGSYPSLIVDNSESGDDLLMVTADGLVPSDTNGTYDVYDLRVNGGFAEPVVESCEGDACQGQSSGARPAAAPGSGMLAWAGSKKESRKGKARSRKALATTQLGRPGPNNARVRIQAPSAGKVSIAGGDVKAKSRQVKPGAVVIAVGLSKTGKQKLARKGQLKATVKVTFRPKSGAVTKKTMKLSYAGPKGGHR